MHGVKSAVIKAKALPGLRFYAGSDKRFPTWEYKIKRGSSTARQEHKGRSGWKLRPSAMLAHALSELVRAHRSRGKSVVQSQAALSENK